MLERIFHLSDAHTTVKGELIAALTTFVSLSYILFVNPNILHAAGINKGAAFTVTAVGCFLMGLIANYPIALAPTLGTSVESSAGIAMGGRTGLTAVFVGILFLISMIFSPLLAVIPTTVTAPALIIVGVLMANNLKYINWDRFEVAFPAFLVVVGMPLTYSISDGLALGMIAYPITMIASKHHKDVSPMMYALFVIFILFFGITNMK